MFDKTSTNIGKNVGNNNFQIGNNNINGNGNNNCGNTTNTYNTYKKFSKSKKYDFMDAVKYFGKNPQHSQLAIKIFESQLAAKQIISDFYNFKIGQRKKPNKNRRPS